VPLRITSATTKVGIVLSTAIVSFLIEMVVGVATGGDSLAVALGALGFTAALAAFCGRTFRGEDEEVAPPRPWWRLTGGLASSATIAGLLLWQVVGHVWSLVVEGADAAVVVLLVGHGLLAAAYLLSAVRQRDVVAGRADRADPGV